MCTNCNKKKDQENNVLGVSEILEVSFACIFKVHSKFFLLIEIESEIPGVDFDEVVIFRISKAQADAFTDAGIGRCRILDEEPSSTRAELVCVLIIDDQAFLVFDLETEPEEVVLVRISIEEAKRRISLGQPRCKVINKDC